MAKQSTMFSYDLFEGKKTRIIMDKKSGDILSYDRGKTDNSDNVQITYERAICEYLITKELQLSNDPIYLKAVQKANQL